MSAQPHGSVIAMEFKARPDISFEDFVEEFDLAFQMVDSTQNSLSWESDDLAIIDRDCVRVAIGWMPATGKRQPWHLVIAVGAPPQQDIRTVETTSYEFLADRILDRTQEFMPATAVLRGEASQAITPELMDALCELLAADTKTTSSDMTGGQPPQTIAGVIREDDEELYAQMVESMTPPWVHAQTAPEEMSHPIFGHTDKNRVQETVAQMMQEPQTSDPMRLTIHTLALSIALYVPPLGVALFAYTMMRDIFPVAAHAL